MSPEVVVKNIRSKLGNYLDENKLKSLVIGVSGGIDSTLCCALAAPVCHEFGIPLIGRSIPIETNKEDEIKRARQTGEAFCGSSFDEVPKEESEAVLYAQMVMCRIKKKDSSDYTIKEKVRIGNLKARIRMAYLFDVAQDHAGLVLSTDNYTEYLLGFFTLHGDVGDYGMIQELWKTEVYALAEYLITEIVDNNQSSDHLNALRSCIDAVPTDGLGITDSDFDQLGYDSYEALDKILVRILNKDHYHIGEREAVKDRMIATEFKRRNPLNLTRDELGLPDAKEGVQL